MTIFPRAKLAEQVEFHGRQARITEALAEAASSQVEREQGAMRYTFHKRQCALWQKSLDACDAATLEKQRNLR